VKLTEAELIGYPWIVIVGRQWASDRMVELRSRRSGEAHLLTMARLVESLCGPKRAGPPGREDATSFAR
jgi:prolyl-tRNA synthetase